MGLQHRMCSKQQLISLRFDTRAQVSFDDGEGNYSWTSHVLEHKCRNRMIFQDLVWFK